MMKTTRPVSLAKVKETAKRQRLERKHGFNLLFRAYRDAQCSLVFSDTTSEVSDKSMIRRCQMDGAHVYVTSCVSTISWLQLYWPLLQNPLYRGHAKKQLFMVPKGDLERWKTFCLLKCVCK
jgi:hypothetical protein